MLQCFLLWRSRMLYWIPLCVQNRLAFRFLLFQYYVVDILRVIRAFYFRLWFIQIWLIQFMKDTFGFWHTFFPVLQLELQKRFLRSLRPSSRQGSLFSMIECELEYSNMDLAPFFVHVFLNLMSSFPFLQLFYLLILSWWLHSLLGFRNYYKQLKNWEKSADYFIRMRVIGDGNLMSEFLCEVHGCTVFLLMILETAKQKTHKNKGIEVDGFLLS